MRLLFLFLYSLVGGSLLVFAQPHSAPAVATDQPIFTNIERQAGIPDAYTPGIFQDSRGFLWLSNKKGLLRYDGLHFKRYQHQAANPHSLSDNFVWHLDEDREGFLWIPTYGGGLNRFDPRTETFTVFPLKAAAVTPPASDLIWTARVDRYNRVWVGTRGDGLYLISADRDSVAHFVHDPADPTSLSGNSIGRILEDRQGRYWVPAEDGGLNLFDPETGRSVRYQHQPENPNSLISNQIYSLQEDERGRLWIPTMAGLSVFDPQENRFTNYTHRADDPNGLSDNLIYSLSIDSRQQIWLATGSGLNHYDPTSEEFAVYTYDPLNPASLHHDFVFTTYEDRSGVLWITTPKGISKLENHNFSFISLVRTLEEKKSSNFEGGFKSLLEDREGELWLGTNNGLYRYDPQLDVYRHYLPHRNWRVEQLAEGPAGNVWVVADGDLYWFDRSADRLRSARAESPGFRAQLPDEFFCALAFDRAGRLWVGTAQQLIKVDPHTLRILQRYTPPPSTERSFTYIRDIQVAPDGRLWLGGDQGGLQCFSPRTGTFTRQRFTPALPASFAPTGKSRYRLDSNGHLWVKTPDHLLRFLPNETDRPQPAGQWLTGDARLHGDEQGRYWLITSTGITAFDPDTGVGPTFSPPGSAPALDGSLLAARDGSLYLGGLEGVYRFRPEQARLNTQPPPVVLTDFQLFNRSVPIQGSYADTLAYPSPLERSISYTEQVQLPYYMNDFSIEFAALDYHHPTRNCYKYLLEGYQEDTLYTTAQRPLATYTNLSPGQYTFRVWGSNNNGFWNETATTLLITVHAPWYWAGWSQTLYLLLGVLLLYTIYRSQLQRQLATHEAQRLQELNEFKTHLYTNITHEFRTPLTVILGMADQVANQPGRWLSSGVSAIRRNAGQLLRLVNQMLDLSKLESGHLALQPVQSDIVQFLRYALESFHSFAESKDIGLHFQAEPAALSMDFDPDRLMDVLTNLLANAIKFTPEGGEVYVDVRADGEEALLLTVRDTGVGIPAEQLPHIFDRFYQADDSPTRAGEGTGIGLALTRELVRLMGGDIRVQSRLGAGSTFTISLPVSRNATKVADAPVVSRESTLHLSGTAALPQHATSESTGSTDRPLALIIEDHADVRQYIAATLKNEYRLVFAPNGRIGIERAIAQVPDIIISDVMMPEKDGFEVCHTLKNDQRCSHIPIILLTAKADVHSRLKGLQRGADAYLPKPFNKVELRIRMRKLLELRRKMEQYYQSLLTESEAAVETEMPDTEVPEKIFVHQIRELIGPRLSDPRFTVEDLSSAAGMSRSQLYRKLKALIGMSTIELIHSLRLSRARELLRDRERTVASVAYDCGFNQPSYFTRVFKKAFGATPKEFREQLDNGNEIIG